MDDESMAARTIDDGQYEYEVIDVKTYTHNGKKKKKVKKKKRKVSVLGHTEYSSSKMSMMTKDKRSELTSPEAKVPFDYLGQSNMSNFSSINLKPR